MKTQMNVKFVWKVIKKGELVLTFSCGHMFHEECIIDYTKIRDFCPICEDKIFSDTQYDDNASSHTAVVGLNNLLH